MMSGRFATALKRDEAVLGDIDRAAFPLQHVSQDRPNRVVVLDDQHARAGLATTMGLKHAAQTVAIEGLGQVVSRAKREPLLLLVEDAQHDNRDGRECRILLELLRTAQPSMRGITDIKRDQGRLELSRQSQALGGIGRGERVEAFPREETSHEVARIGIVVDHKHRRSAGPRSRCSRDVRRFRAPPA